MANEITLSAAVRNNLLALRDTEDLISRTQSRLSTGLKIASPIDVDQAISSVKTALEAIEAVDSLVSQMKGLLVSAKTATGNELTSIQNQYNELRVQIDNLTKDAAYQGLSLINGTGENLQVSFSTDSTSVMNINSVDLRVGSLGLNIASAANYSLSSVIDAALNEIKSAKETLRGQAQQLGSNIAILQARLDFTATYTDILEDGAGKLNLANITEEGANLVALQTRQQLGISALAFAGQSEQSVLQLFR